MLSLNLVSQQLKQEIKLRHIYEMLKKVNGILIVITVFIAIIILSAKVILQNNFNRIVEQTTLITRSSQGHNAKIREVNARLNYVDDIQNNFIAWSYLLEDIAGSVDDNIKFNLIKVNKEEEEIILKGVARSRNNLLALKEGLEDSEIFANIDFPIKNILEKEDINFEITVKLNLEKIGPN